MKPVPEVASTDAESVAPSNGEQPNEKIKVESRPDSIGVRARAQLAAIVETGTKRLSKFEEMLARSETSTLTFGDISKSVSAVRSAAMARAEALRLQAKSRLDKVDRAPGRAVAVLATRTRVSIHAIAQTLRELEKRLER